MKKVKSCLSMLVMVTMLASGVMLPAQAAMIQTKDLATQTAASADKDRINQFLAQDNVREQLTKQGYAPAEIAARIDSLSGAEISLLAQKIDELPAGGINVLGVAAMIFLVLLFTDIMGFTNIFPFVVTTAN